MPTISNKGKNMPESPIRKLVPFVGDDKIMQGEMEKSRVFVQEFEF